MKKKFAFVILLSCLLTQGFSEEKQENLILSTPDQIAALMSQPSDLIGGLISPLSGQCVLRQTDLIAKGAQSIVLNRIYSSPYMPCHFQKLKRNQEQEDKKALYYHLKENYKGWQFYPHLILRVDFQSMKIRVPDPNGMTLDFKFSYPSGSVHPLVFPAYAISNTSGDEPSGKYDPRNTRISYEGNADKIGIYAPDNTTRFYRRKFNGMYLLEKEILPNGKVLKYYYDAEKGLKLTRVESLDPKERYVYATMHLTISPGNHYNFVSSSGLESNYKFQIKNFNWKIQYKSKKEEGRGDSPPVLTSVSSPFYKFESLNYSNLFLLDSYYGKDSIFSVSYAGFGERESQYFRVQKLSLPVGQNDAFAPVYEMNYNPPKAGQTGGTTTVKSSDGISILYHFSKDLLTTCIQYFDQEKNLKKEKLFKWDDRNWLKSLEIRDAQKNILFRKSYEYDSFGNPTLETLTGDLTGEGSQDTFTIQRTFTEDGRNLLLKEEREDGKILCFSYLPNTNLITSKFTKDKDKIILREFFIYDDCNNLIQTIADDGSSEDKDNLSHITERTIKTYILRKSAPFLHMPEWIEESYLEAGSQKLLKKTHLIYDKHGNVVEEEIYDAEGKHAYTLYKTYNERGDILTETTPLGQEATYTYDSKGRLETSTNSSGRLHTTFKYDTKGRLRQKTKKGADGNIHTTTFKYDAYDRLISKQDPFHNSTSYTYDPLVNEVIKTDFPSIPSLERNASSVKTQSSYDSFGREITKTDANGNTIHYRYNAYGLPVEITYPHGGKEHFRYAKNGSLVSHINQDGLKIDYQNDIFGRILQKTYISKEEEILAKETFTYSGFNLLFETDKENHLKQYTYDGAGRKIRQDSSGKVTEFRYDPLGWLSTIYKYNGNNTLLIHYKRDLEGKILEEEKTDLLGNILRKINYSYDADGNLATITRQIHEKEATQTFTYDSFSRITEHRDAEGYVTSTTYIEDYTNSLNQKVLQIKTVDSKGITTIETQDALARASHIETLNPHGSIISSFDLYHDPHGNLLYRQDHIHENAILQSTQTARYTYTPHHQIKTLTRAVGTQDERTTTYTYLPSGKLATKTLPDAVTLTYNYHPLGFIDRITSSDGKIQHSFKHNRLGHLLLAIDENQNTTIEREVDPFGNTTCETFPQGFEVKKSYDDFDRPISLSIKSQGTIFYTYDPILLREVTRISNKGQTLYTHTYDDYDLDGNLTSEHLIADLGQVIHTTNLKRQKTSISSPYFTQTCTYDPVGNLSSNIIDDIENIYSYDDTFQISSENSPFGSITYSHDSLYNRTQKNAIPYEVNALNELLSTQKIQYAYDLNGNQILKKTASETTHFIYDPLNRLIEITSDKQKTIFTYDPLGRRLSKTIFIKTNSDWEKSNHEDYLYDDQDEIGAFENPNTPKNFRVLGNHLNTIAIEINNQHFAPITDIQGNICCLIDPKTKTLTKYNFSAFGQKQHSPEPLFIPWRFASKRLDPESNLIYFGKRYYDPILGRWITPDPAGPLDSYNPYQYVLNNPFKYHDPYGEFVFAIPLIAWGAGIVVPTISGCAVPIIYGAIAGGIAYGGYKSIQALNERDRARYSIANPQTIPGETLPIRMEKNEGPPSNNSAQNKQARDARKEIERKIGRELTPDEIKEFHDHITKQGYGYHELVEEGIELFDEN